MDTRITLLGFAARSTPWKYTTAPEKELEFKPGTRLTVTHPPKQQYGGSVRYVGFVIEGETQTYFTSSSHFKEFTDSQIS